MTRRGDAAEALRPAEDRDLDAMGLRGRSRGRAAPAADCAHAPGDEHDDRRVDRAPATSPRPTTRPPVRDDRADLARRSRWSPPAAGARPRRRRTWWRWDRRSRSRAPRPRRRRRRRAARSRIGAGRRPAMISVVSMPRRCWHVDVAGQGRRVLRAHDLHEADAARSRSRRPTALAEVRGRSSGSRRPAATRPRWCSASGPARPTFRWRPAAELRGARAAPRCACPGRARWKAVLVPLAPPPMTTTSAVAFIVSVLASGRDNAALLTGLRADDTLPLPSPSRSRGAYPSLAEGGLMARLLVASCSEAGRRGGGRVPSRRAARLRPDHAEARAGGRPGRRHRQVRSALEHLGQRHPRLVQPLRQPVSRHPDGKLYPGLATEWKLTAPTTWTFKLRRGVKFHNGDPLSAADAKWSIERTCDPNEDAGEHRVHHDRADRGAGCRRRW